MNITTLSLDLLKTLGLYSDEKGFNNAAALLADENAFPGIEIIEIDDSGERTAFSIQHTCLLKQYYETLEYLKKKCVVNAYSSYSRSTYELIPFIAIKEALENAIIHRAYDSNENTRIEAHETYIKIISPGNIPFMMSNEDFSSGKFFYLRNPLVAKIFCFAGILKRYGVGIKNINSSYMGKIFKPAFECKSDRVTVSLPLQHSFRLGKKEGDVYDLMDKNIIYKCNDLIELTGLTKSTLLRNINSLIEKGLVEKQGEARATTYIKK